MNTTIIHMKDSDSTAKIVLTYDEPFNILDVQETGDESLLGLFDMALDEHIESGSGYYIFTPTRANVEVYVAVCSYINRRITDTFCDIVGMPDFSEYQPEDDEDVVY